MAISIGERQYIKPEWSAPDNVQAFSTTRIGGASLAPYAGFNIAEHVGDEQQKVDENRELLVSDLGLAKPPFWLEQVHGVDLVDVDLDFKYDSPNKSSVFAKADASASVTPHNICAIMTADCLPVLFCNKQGTWVAAVHAGWRGLASGILEKAVEVYKGSSSDIIVWLGPAISQHHFEVGEEVRQIFLENSLSNSVAFVKSNSEIAEEKVKYRCDLYQISRMILGNYGIEVFGGEFCTFSDPDQFYSYRRDGETGRMASLIWINQ